MRLHTEIIRKGYRRVTSTTHLYLSVIPEALIVSMLPPKEFGKYYAVGTRQRSRDASGPSLNSLIKLMSMVAIVMAGVTLRLALV